MTATLDLTESQILVLLRSFLIDVLPAAMPVLQGQTNRVAEPCAGNFAMYWPTNRTRLSTNRHGWAITDPAAATMDVLQATQITVQIDIHGDDGADNAQRVTTLLRDPYGVEFFAASNLAVRPLYASDPQQMPFINGEKQYEDRWVILAVLQANPVVSTAQQFADTLALDIVEVDATFPPGV